MEQGDETVDRSPADLEEAGYAPVWTSELGYPGDIPEEIVEFIDPGVEQGHFLIGPLSSIFWLKKVEVLNELIFDPGHKLEDEIFRIPDGGAWFWLVQALFDQNKIPERYMNMVSYGVASLDEALPQVPLRNIDTKDDIPTRPGLNISKEL